MTMQFAIYQENTQPQARERCQLPSLETRTTIGSRTIFSDMTRYLNAMPQPSEVPTSGPRPDYGGAQCQSRVRLQVAMPNQPANSDELNTPVFETENIFQSMPETVATPTMDDYTELGFNTGISFVSTSGLDSQELMQTLMHSQEAAITPDDPMLTDAVSSSQASQSDSFCRLNLKLEIKAEPQVDTTTTPCAVVDTPDILNEFGGPRFNLLDYINDPEATFEPLDPLESAQQPATPATNTIKFNELKPMPSPPSPVMVINAPSPDSTSPASVQSMHGGTSSAPQHVIAEENPSMSSDYEASDSDISYKRPGSLVIAGPSTSKRSRFEDDMSSIPSSANELKVFEHRQRNNAASRRSRMNKKSKDEENEQVLDDLERRHQALLAKVTSLENIRNRLRVAALAKCRGK